jgi:hypothetical protein
MNPADHTPVRPRNAWWSVVSALALLAAAASTAAADTRTITGQIVYGTINNDILEFVPPTNVIFPSLPIPHVKVELNDGWTLPVGVSDITDANGRFRFTFSGTPQLTLVTKAENDYVAVKKHHGVGQNWFGDDVLKSHVDISGRVDYGTCLDGDTCDVGTVTVVSDPVDSFQTINGALTNYVFQVGDAPGSFQIVRYENQLGTYIDQNDAPPPPANLSSSYDTVRGGYLFSWTAPAGGSDETPTAGFGYELRVGTTSSGGRSSAGPIRRAPRSRAIDWTAS